MTVVDYVIFLVYFLTMLGVGFYFYKKNKNLEDYYVGGRSLKSWHIGLSVVATDVGGGFSIGLGGLGFVMGVSGSWMLFTGLIGAWLSAVVLIPVIVKLSAKHKFFTFPQLLAGAKLASATFAEIDMTTALIIMGVVAVVYTGIGGLKAVIYTDTIQWLILMCGLVLIGIPIAYSAIGGMDVIRATIGKEFLSMTNVTWQQLVNWGVTIIPIWFVGMTLYQRIYASKNKKQAQRAWFIAGLFEWPLMALMGTVLGMFARVAFENGMFTAAGYPPGAGIDSETALPVLLNTVLPAGLMGLMLAAYFSAILSTADSCLMAASGNVQTDILDRIFKPAKGMKAQLRISQIITLAIGVLALVLAHSMSNVLELMLYSYAFMVSGLFVPILAALYTRKPKAAAALPAMIAGGTTTILLILLKVPLPFGLNENIFGITVSAVFYILISIFTRKSNQKLSNP